MQVARSRLVELLKALHVDSVDGWNSGKLAVRVNQDNGIARYSDTPEPFPPGSEFQTLFSEIVADQAAGNAVEVLDDVPVETEVVAPTANGKPNKAPAPKKSPQKTPAKPPASKSGEPRKHVGKKTAQKAEPPSKKPAKSVAKNPDKSSGKVHVRKVPKSNKSVKARRLAAYGGFNSFKEHCAHLAKHPYPIPNEGIVATIHAELVAAGKGHSQNKHKPVTKEFLLGVLKEKFPDRDPVKMWASIEHEVPSRLRWKYGIHVWRRRLKGQKTEYFIVGKGDKPQPKPEKVETPSKSPPKKKSKKNKKSKVPA